MHDWDGTDVDTMPSHADLAAKVIRKHFGLTISDARSKYLATTGVPFDGQLEKFFRLLRKRKEKHALASTTREKCKRSMRAPKLSQG